MKALVISRPSGPEALQVQDIPEPAATAGQTLVEVEAGGLNFADLMTVQGGYPGTPNPPLTAGREFAGRRLLDGQPVMGYAQWGAFAEKVAAKSMLLWPIPEGWNMEMAAAFPVNYFTAYLAYWKAGLLDAAGHPETPRVLIHAAAGGVGTAAVEIGHLLGFELYGTSSTQEKLQRVSALGLQHGINYTEQDYEDAIKELTHGEGVDVVFEMLGGEHTAKSIRCLRDFGRVIVYGSATGKQAQLDTRALYAKGGSVHGLWLTYLSGKQDLMVQAWKRLAAWAHSGKLHPVVGHVLPIERAAEAYRLLQDRKNFGKVVLTIQPT